MRQRWRTSGKDFFEGNHRSYASAPADPRKDGINPMDHWAPASFARGGRLGPGGSRMAAPLRVFPFPLERSTDAQEPTVRVTLGDLLPLVALAQRKNYVWLQDFLDDEVAITPDLEEVLSAFRAHRPSA